MGRTQMNQSEVRNSSSRLHMDHHQGRACILSFLPDLNISLYLEGGAATPMLSLHWEVGAIALACAGKGRTSNSAVLSRKLDWAMF